MSFSPQLKCPRRLSRFFENGRSILEVGAPEISVLHSQDHFNFLGTPRSSTGEK